ncbi:MAG: VOC family protein [Dehalococcoidia bacterium]|jgi:methylmalonyl-CoA/ethylmalonyl-CoA epimerase|nr:VOC family protein [Dehalococcoidia bacterium]MDW8009520.1 VOC family protein [Chloroflexota bacterium]
MANPMGIKRMDHVSWAVWKIDDVLPLLTQLMGMEVVARFRDEEQGYAGVALRVPGTNTEFEVLEPVGEDSFLVRFLRERGPGLHHVTFIVEDADRAAEAIRAFGIEPWGGVRRRHDWGETFIHPRDSGGVLFQFYTEMGHDHGEGAAK